VLPRGQHHSTTTLSPQHKKQKTMYEGLGLPQNRTPR